ncbi:MAG: GntR family transcriptional regulator [Actinobacteria bacterium]|nr:GntR family transcriptional regulator [Actinomycetota bacterium]
MDLKYRHKNLSDYAYKKIKTLILNDILKNGEKIVQEKMAKKLGISKIPIIQALTILQNERLIEYYPRRGFFVRELTYKEFIEILDIRRILESLAIKKIIENLNEQIKSKLLEFLDGFELYNKTKKYKKYYDLDKKFHYYLIEASNNSYLININDTFNILLLCYTKGFKTDINISIEHHRKIIDAILNKETEKAINLIKEHTEHKKESHLIEANKTNSR